MLTANHITTEPSAVTLPLHVQGRMARQRLLRIEAAAIADRKLAAFVLKNAEAGPRSRLSKLREWVAASGHDAEGLTLKFKTANRVWMAIIEAHISKGAVR